jgi:hypothetical protein
MFGASSDSVFLQDINFLSSDWVFSDPSGPFTINLSFPNALDPDNPLAKLPPTSLEVFDNQTVPHLYLRISSITGVFPQNIRLLISNKVLYHRGVLSADHLTNTDGIILGKCPPVTKDCTVTVLMLCDDGLPIPQGYAGFPAGFPASLPPEGTIRSYLGDDCLTEDMFECYADKYEAAVAAVSPVLDRRFQLAKFNAQARYDRRLWVQEMKAIWDFQHQSAVPTDSSLSPALSDSDIQHDLHYASYLDYMNAKMTLYDEDYRTRLVAFKHNMADAAPVLTDRDRALIDSESILRQSRTQALWKGLARVRVLRAQMSSYANSPMTRPAFGWDAVTPEVDVLSPTSLPLLGENLDATHFSSRKIFLTTKIIRRVLNFKESIMKYGIFIPRNDREADASPEAPRWDSGRQLEWLRLRNQGTFERNWDWERVTKKFPNYKKVDIGHVFFVYDFKFSGEHRVRLVFDGSKQNPETYTETYAPTARGESVRLFHIFAVEESYTIAQYDVPQAFLKSEIDCDLFVYPPRNFSEFPGQLLKLKLSLYGAKQSAALWNAMIL